MFTKAQIRTASRELQDALERIRAKEVRHEYIVLIIVLLCDAAIIVAYFALCSPYSASSSAWRPPLEIASFALFTIALMIGGRELGLRALRTYSRRTRFPYEALRELLSQAPYRSIAERIRTDRFQYRKNDSDDTRNLDYSGIIGRA